MNRIHANNKSSSSRSDSNNNDNNNNIPMISPRSVNDGYTNDKDQFHLNLEDDDDDDAKMNNNSDCESMSSSSSSSSSSRWSSSNNENPNPGTGTTSSSYESQVTYNKNNTNNNNTSLPIKNKEQLPDMTTTTSRTTTVSSATNNQNNNMKKTTVIQRTNGTSVTMTDNTILEEAQQQQKRQQKKRNHHHHHHRKKHGQRRTHSNSSNSTSSIEMMINHQNSKNSNNRIRGSSATKVTIVMGIFLLVVITNPFYMAIYWVLPEIKLRITKKEKVTRKQQNYQHNQPKSNWSILHESLVATNDKSVLPITSNEHAKISNMVEFPPNDCNDNENNNNNNNNNNNECCATWNQNTDLWWLKHYEWEVSYENSTHTCFQKIRDDTRIQFIRQVHELQTSISSRSTTTTTGDNLCPPDVVYSTQISSGYAAALMAVVRSFYVSYQQKKPFQITRGHDNAQWNFAVPWNNVSYKENHWAYCSTGDLNCYFLPIMNCTPPLGQNTADRGLKPDKSKYKAEFFWLKQYTFRPKHILRYQLIQFQKRKFVAKYLFTENNNNVNDGSSSSLLNKNCVAIHVRRTDIAFGKGRRYAAVHEYLSAGNVSYGDTVVLLTDDDSTIQEVNRYHKTQYNWLIIDRPRFHGSEGGFEGFVPSNDPSEEVLAIITETKLAGHCHTLVYGKSGFVALILDEFNTFHGFENYTSYRKVYLQTQQDKKEQPKIDPAVRSELYLQQIQEKLAQTEQKQKIT